MTKAGTPSDAADDVHEEMGHSLREARKRLGMSVNQLAKLSRVSRRHIGVASEGGNISVGILKKLMRTLELREISLGSGLHARSEMPSEGAILEAVDRLEATARQVLQEAAEIRALLAAPSGRAMNRKAAELIRDAAAHAGSGARRAARGGAAPRAARRRRG